jgi:hypothetical protein
MKPKPQVCNLCTSNTYRFTNPAIVCLREAMPVAFYPITPNIVVLAFRPTGCVSVLPAQTPAYTFGMLYGNTCTVWLHSLIRKLPVPTPAVGTRQTLPLSLQCPLAARPCASIPKAFGMAWLLLAQGCFTREICKKLF